MSSATSESRPWGAVILACLLVNLSTLSGLLIVALAFAQRGWLRSKGEDDSHVEVGRGRVFDVCIPAFAVGALLATAVFLIFPESVHLIEGAHADHGDGDDHAGHDHRYLQDDHDDHGGDSEGANAAKFGCAVLGGFLLPLVFSIFFHHDDPTAMEENSSDAAPESDGEEDEKAVDAETGVAVAVQKVEPEGDDGQANHATTESTRTALAAKPLINKKLCASILLGDGFHNFGDGIFIGAAFQSCSTGTAISIVLVTLFHELAQELADFVILTRYAGLSVAKACVLNFLSGLSVVLGGVVFLAVDPSDQATGIILAMAGGVYFNIAACDAIPRIESVSKGAVDRVWTLVMCVIGTIPIGLILINHEHC